MVPKVVSHFVVAVVVVETGVVAAVVVVAVVVVAGVVVTGVVVADLVVAGVDDVVVVVVVVSGFSHILACQHRLPWRLRFCCGAVFVANQIFFAFNNY